MGTIESGNLSVVYAKTESAFGTLATPASTDGVRTLGTTFTAKLNRTPSPERRASPGVAQMLPRRKTVEWAIQPSMWEPSGTVGTASYFGELLKAGFGTQTTPALTTTVNDDAATATGATLTSATDLAVGDLMTFVVGGGARTEVTRITAIDSLAVTFDELSAAPDDASAAVAGVTYKLASSVTASLSIFLFHTAASNKEAISGAIVNEMTFDFDGTEEVKVSLSGMAASLVRTGFTQPAAFTVVGDPLSGVDVGNVYVDDTAFLIQKASIKINNGFELRNSELGTSTASGYFRGANRRAVTASIDYYFDDVSLITKSEALTTAEIRILVGASAGKRVGMVLPKVEFEIPPIGDQNGPIVLSQDCRALETTGNDEVYAAEL